MTLDDAISAAGARMLDRIAVLGGISQSNEWLERSLFSPASEAAAYKLKEWMTEAGLDAYEDELTNVVGSRIDSLEGKEGSTIHLGSHYDTVVNAGAYDGALGVLVGIAVADVIHTAGLRLNHNLGVNAFCDEEGVRFQSTFLGSAYLSGQFEEAWLQMPDEFGKTLGEWLVDRAESIDAILHKAPVIRPQDYFLEAHIEQGPVLESAGWGLGVFTRVAAQMRSEVEITGCAGHAGTTPARLRKDPLPVASEMVMAVHELCRSDERIRATVGYMEVKPNASNVIPSSVRFMIDLRHPSESERDACHETLVARLEAIAKRSGLEYCYRVVHEESDVVCDPGMTDLLSEACVAQQGDVVYIFSGAGHDSMKISHTCPVGILAVRCREGLSHHPDEFATEADCMLALRVMVDAVLKLDQIK